jgi:hypothetical protein
MRIKQFALAATILAASLAAVSVGKPANAGTCWYETAWYEKYGCQIQGKTPAGKYILICCN